MEYGKYTIRNGNSLLLVDIGDNRSRGPTYDTTKSKIIKKYLSKLQQMVDVMTEGDKNSYSSISTGKPEVNVIRYEDFINGSESRDDSDSINSSSGSDIDSFAATVESKLSSITLDGGLGGVVIINCENYTNRGQNYYRKQLVSSNYSERLLKLLNLAMKYMIFRRVGAVINVVEEVRDTDEKQTSFPSINPLIDNTIEKADAAFTTQLIRSISYEYSEYGIDCVAVSIHDDDWGWNQLPRPSKDTIVRASFNMLGYDSEMDVKYCYFTSFVDMLFTK